MSMMTWTDPTTGATSVGSNPPQGVQTTPYQAPGQSDATTQMYGVTVPTWYAESSQTPDTQAYQQNGIGGGNQSAWGVIQQYLQQMGITDPQAMTWAQNLITQGASSSQIEVDMYDQPWFKARFPQIQMAQQNGLPPISPADVISYEKTVSQMEQQVGLPQGFVSQDDIANLMGKYNVSASELSDRLTQGYAASQQAVQNTPEIAQTLGQYYGVGPGGLAAYWLDPTKALATLQNQYSAATIGAEGALTGWGNLGKSTAQQLASLGVTQQQAEQGFSSLAHMSQAYGVLPGQQGSGVSKQQQVAGQFEGDAQAQLAMQLASETRQAAFQGGSNYTSTSQGAQGVGEAVPNR